ncbi:MAG TPA: hypothetical protein VFR09_04530 [Alphaproteobacteria bacterium]|nr:hypothetical protein [Alphaproteobacteria bacterium]
MVDSINNSSSNSLLRAQHLAQVNNVSNVNKTQTVINQTRSAAVVPVKNTNAVSQSTKVAVSADQVLPRGSIVDRLV